MLNNLAKYLTAKLLSKGNISEDEQELYIYGFFMLFSSLMYLILACLLGLVLDCLLESILFYVAFQCIRRYAGGYHASTETKCEILSTLAVSACIALIRLSEAYDFRTALFGLTVLSAGCIFFLCPMDTPEKPLTEKEFVYFRRISRIFVCVIFSAVILTYFFRVHVLFTPCCLSLVLESILLVAAKLKKQGTSPKNAARQ